MGGCRCVFRNCPVGTSRNPKMHFFRFPVRDNGRLLKWSKISNNPDLVYLPIPQQKNKVVCARHFRDECFMNYMRNKLVATAVPTLERLKGGYALDYDTEGNIPVMIKLPESKLPHMIAPKGFCCPLELDDDDEVLGAIGSLQKVDTSEDSVLTVEIENEDVLEVLPEPVEPLRKVEAPKRLAFTTTHKRAAPLQKTVNNKKPKILNFLSFTVPENSNQNSVEQEMSYSMELQDSGLEQQQQEGRPTCNRVCDEEINLFKVINVKETSVRMGQVHDIAINTDVKVFNDRGIQVNIDDATQNNEREQDNLQTQLQRERKKYDCLEKNMLQQFNQLQQALDLAHRQAEISELQLDKLNDEHIKLKMENQNLTIHNKKSKTEIITLRATQTELELRCKEIQQKHENVVTLKNQLESKNHALQQQQQVSTVSTSKNSFANQNLNSSVSSGTLTKAQLFNGIKKYLSSSMTALVRMEMFGSTERTWKPDEKQAALDLFGLGENIYKYFTDEWRFRLPGLRQVKEWFSETTTASLEDDDEDL